MSLIINLVLIGLVAGGAYKRYSHHSKIPDDLTIAAQQKIKASMKISREEMKRQHQKMRQDRAALKAIIEAEEFDSVAYAAEIEKMLTSKSDIERIRAQNMGDVLSELSQEDRQKISKRFLKSLSGKGGKGDKRKREGGNNRPPKNYE